MAKSTRPSFALLIVSALAAPSPAFAANVFRAQIKTVPTGPSGIALPAGSLHSPANIKLTTPGSDTSLPSLNGPSAALRMSESASASAETSAQAGERVFEAQSEFTAPLFQASPVFQPAELTAKSSPSDETKLWDRTVPAREARSRLRKAKWQTMKFFLGPRIKMLRGWIKEQEASTDINERAVKNLEGMWMSWRTKGLAGKIQTSGFMSADRKTIRREAEGIYDKYFPKDPEIRAAFHRYLDRVDAYVPLKRPSNYWKHALDLAFRAPLMKPGELKAYFDSRLAPEEIAVIQRHREEKNDLIVASFKEAVKKSILQVNRGLPEGQKIVALILLGSYAIGQSTPKSDIDYQLVTQDGGKTAIPLFKDALDKNWVENRLDTIEAFQFTLPPSPEVVRESFLEGYQVVSPDPAAVEAMTFPVSPAPTTAWVKVRGKLFEWAYRSWIWTNFRLMDIKDAFAR